MTCLTVSLQNEKFCCRIIEIFQEENYGREVDYSKTEELLKLWFVDRSEPCRLPTRYRY